MEPFKRLDAFLQGFAIVFCRLANAQQDGFHAAGLGIGKLAVFEVQIVDHLGQLPENLLRRPKASSNTSKVQRSCSWVKSPSGTSNDTPLGTAVTIRSVSRNSNRAWESMNRRISQAEAMRSTKGFRRVTQTLPW